MMQRINILGSVLGKSLLFLAMAIGGRGELYGQDPQFSQYFSSPLTINPALGGKDVQDWRLTSNYRSQWFSSGYSHPYLTATLSVENRLAKDKLGKNQLAWQALLMTDASNGGLLKRNFFSLGLSYQNALDAEGNQLLGAGLQVNYTNRILDPTKFIFQNQFGSGGFPVGGIATDGVNIARSNFVSMSAGVHYAEKKTKWGYALGAALYNFGNPGDGAYTQGQHAVLTRVSLQASYRRFFNNGNELDLVYLSQHQGNGLYERDRFTLGAVYQYRDFEPDKTIQSLNLGIFNRFGDAGVLYLGLEMADHWLFGFSYDFVVPSIHQRFSNLTSMEVGLAWQFARKSRKSNDRTALLPFSN